MQDLDAFGFVPSVGAWRPIETEPDVSRDRLVLVTCDVWFDEFLWREGFAKLNQSRSGFGSTRQLPADRETHRAHHHERCESAEG